MKKLLTGVVKSTKMAKTASVIVTRMKTHPLYEKKTKVTKSYLAENLVEAKEGDTVVMESTRPISKNKHFRILSIKIKK